MDERRILVAEDSVALRRIIVFTLERAGFSVTAVDDGLAAWQAAQATPFSLVVTDCQMPGLQGPELCQRLRALPAYRHVPILMLTAKRYELDAESLREELGIAGVIAKPFSPSQLIATVDECLAAVP